MIELKYYYILGIFFVAILGTLLHFLYQWSGNHFFIGLFSPINESIWEHMKLLFFPMLLYSFLFIPKLKKNYPCIISSLCFGILIGTLLIPVLFYTYTSFTGNNIFFLDIATFILSIIIAFFISYRLTLSCKAEPYHFLLYGLIIILFLCFALFTYYPPNLPLFLDPTMPN